MPVDLTLSVINGKWKPMILWLLAARPCRFGDFQAAMPSLAHEVLSQLESDGLVCRVPRESQAQRMGFC